MVVFTTARIDEYTQVSGIRMWTYIWGTIIKSINLVLRKGNISFIINAKLFVDL
jgi:hypothetical protein